MSYTLTNTNQLSLIPVLVIATPLATPEMLIYTLNSSGITTEGVQGAILPPLQVDQVIPYNWYHGGYNLLTTDDLSFFSDNDLAISNLTITTTSGWKTKGLFELRVGAAFNITTITTVGNYTQLYIPLHNYEVNTFIKIEGTNCVPDGVYKIVSIDRVVNVDTFLIDYYDAYLPVYVGGGTSTSFEYFWDEIFTTPLGLYQAIAPASTVGYYEFKIENDNQIHITIEDMEQVIPKIGDTIVLQRFFSDLNSYTNQSGTDGNNTVKSFYKTDNFIAKISSIATVFASTSSGTTYVCNLDKSVTLMETYPGSGAYEKYMVVLLNREGIPTNRELKPETWSLNEVHREQLLGDPYNYSGSTTLEGRMNFLNYGSAKYLGFVQQFSALLDKNLNTPLVFLHVEDEIKDRLSIDPNTFELHLPTVMVQGESNPFILTNTAATEENVEGIGRYTGLYSSSGKRYGWLLHDWRIIIIDDGELTLAVGYNSERNYTLPKPQLPSIGNSKKNFSVTNPLYIVSIQLSPTISTPTRITVNRPHGYLNGDRIYIDEVVGPTINSSILANIYVNVISATEFDIYSDSSLASIYAINTFGQTAYTLGGICYSDKPEYEYYLTYRLKSATKKTLPYTQILPFNFQTNGEVDNVNGNVEVIIDKLTYLSEFDGVNSLVVKEGFEAEEIEFIIGKYMTDFLDNRIVVGLESNTVMSSTISLRDVFGTQNSSHTITLLKTDWNISQLDPAAAYNLTDNSLTPSLPNLIPATQQAIYNTTLIDQSLLTAANNWLIGIIRHKEEVEQYRLEFTVTIPASKWNTTVNPTFDVANNNDKLITEIGFFIDDLTKPKTTGGGFEANPSPYVYAKISPPIKKNNQTDITFKASIDF